MLKTALYDLTKNNMALNLNIPALQEDSIFIAETNPQKINQSLANLKATSPVEIATYLHTELEILNRQKISPSHRMQALDSYRPLLMNTVQTLAEDYCMSALPLNDRAKQSVGIIESLLLELGYGYKLSLVDLQNQLIRLGTDKSSAHAIQCAMHAIAEHALVYYQTYVNPPHHIWSDLHQLYFCAVQLGIQHDNIQQAYLATEKIEPGTASACPITSIDNTYKHALLMSLAESQHLSQKDMTLIARYLAHHVSHAQITAITTLKNASGAFIISLDSNSPPVPYSKQKSAPNPVTDILLQTIDLVRTMHQDLGKLQNHQFPSGGSIPNNADYEDYIQLLTYLIKNWGIMPKRIFNRSLKKNEIKLTSGIVAIHRISNEKFTANNSNDKELIAELNKLRPASARPSRWQSLNISATGILLRRHHTAEKNIRVGGLIGVKAENDIHWSIGFVRWANCGKRDRLDIGVQLLAPQAQATLANINDINKDEPVLLLPAIPAMKQVATIVAPKGTYTPARQLTLSINDQTQQIMLTKLIERSYDVEHIQYSIIS